MLNGTEKTPPLITDYREYHTDTTVKFVVKMTEEKLAEAERVGLHKVFKLQTSLTCNSMVCLILYNLYKKMISILKGNHRLFLYFERIVISLKPLKFSQLSYSWLYSCFCFCFFFQVLFDHVGCLKKYDTVLDILRDFYELRLKYYGLRKEWLLGMLGAESAKLNNQARFILEKIDGKIIIGMFLG